MVLNIAANDRRRLALESEDIKMALLLSVGDENVTDADTPITVGRTTYTPTEDLVQAAVPDKQEAAARDLYTLVFAGNKTSLTSGRWTGTPVEVSIVFRDSQGYTEPLNVYKGLVSRVQQTTQNEEIRTTVSCTGELAQIDGSRITQLTEHDQKARAAPRVDTSLDFIDDDRELRWGAR